MKKFIFIVILLVFPVSISSAITDMPFTYINNVQLMQPAKNEFVFIVFGDFRTSRRDRPYPVAFTQILNEINMISPSFVISVGDAYYGYGGAFQKFKNEVDYFLNTIGFLDTPLFNIIGNHEIGASPERETYIKERFGSLYGSFDFGNSHFIMLNTEEISKEGILSSGQLKWLEKDLESNKDAENILVFMHRPLFSMINSEQGKAKSDADRDHLHAIFRKYKVKAVFAGHEHIFSKMVKDGMVYIITGGGGAPIYQPPSRGGFFHYLLVKVTGKDILVEDMEPYKLRVRNISGNDGFEQRAEIEVENISNADLVVRNISLKMPRANVDKYRVIAVSISPKELKENHPAKIAGVKNNGDGTATVRVETSLHQNSLIRIIVEVDI